MLHMLFSFLIVLIANQTHGQGVDSNFLDEEAVSVSGSIDTSIFDEGEGPGFHPMDVIDSVKSFRIEKKIKKTERAIKETERARKAHDSRMASECSCVFSPCLEAERRNDTRTQAEKEADEERARRAWRQRKSLCWRWFCSGGGHFLGLGILEDDCPGGKIRQGGDDEGFYEQLKALTAELDRERAVEEWLRQQRRVDEKRRREAQIEAQIAAQAAERERRRQRAEAERREYEAKELAWCRKAWSQRRNPCGCVFPAEAPAWVREASVCEK